MKEHLILGGSRAPVRVRVRGGVIRKKRSELGLSQKSVARPLGLLRQRISDLERGHSRTIEGEYVESLSKALGCEVSDLMLPPTRRGILLDDTARRCREALDMTVADLAYEVGVTVEALIHYEAGHKRAPFEVVWRLAKYFEAYFGCSMLDFYAPRVATDTPEYDCEWLEYRDRQGIWHLCALPKNMSPEIEEDTSNSSGLLRWWAAKGSSAA